MTRILHFVKKPETRKYNIQNIDFELDINEHTFPPSPHGSFFAENMKINPGETVIDIGTGSGFLGILAAKLGGNVSATDNDTDALNLAKQNAKKNKVNIDFQKGSYFADYKKKFDIIVVNLPQEIVHIDYQKAIGKQLTESFDGGPDGNKQILEFLDLAKPYMYNKSKIYIIIYTVTDYTKTLKKMIENYNTKLIAFDSGPTKEFVEDNIKFYKELNEAGKIKIFKSNKKWMAHEYLFELTLK
ncbi:methyltransferase [Candidatus Parcubacteria bacterium]|jgi:HemK-related putative methylase|nr:methyltransferase [Candidatus Parcubacteria bacterium]MBT3948883.1 methyltransferase [Candidatus Parcubacteria bacterium]